MGFAKPIEQYLFGNQIHVFMYLKDIIRGEKLYEELLIDEENKKETKNKRIFIGSPRMMETEQFSELIAELDHAAFSEDPNIREVVKRLVPEYTYKQTK